MQKLRLEDLYWMFYSNFSWKIHGFRVQFLEKTQFFSKFRLFLKNSFCMFGVENKIRQILDWKSFNATLVTILDPTSPLKANFYSMKSNRWRRKRKTRKMETKRDFITTQRSFRICSFYWVKYLLNIPIRAFVALFERPL